MAEDNVVPIIIASDDDDSDEDDVVLIKEEIEVDSEDVIFLSETKPTPKLDDVVSTLTSALPAHSSANSLSPSVLAPSSLSRSLSVTTQAGQLSLDDDKANICSLVQRGSSVISSTGPLDLSSKHCDNMLGGSSNVMQSQNICDNRQNCDTAGNGITNFTPTDTSNTLGQFLNDAIGNCVLTSFNTNVDASAANSNNFYSSFSNTGTASVSPAKSNATSASGDDGQGKDQTFKSESVTLLPQSEGDSSSTTVITNASSVAITTADSVSNGVTSHASTEAVSNSSTGQSNQTSVLSSVSSSDSVILFPSVSVITTASSAVDNSGLQVPVPAVSTSTDTLPSSANLTQVPSASANTSNVNLAAMDPFTSSHHFLAALNPTNKSIQYPVLVSSTTGPNAFSQSDFSIFTPTGSGAFSNSAPGTVFNSFSSCLSHNAAGTLSNSTNLVGGLPGGSLRCVSPPPYPMQPLNSSKNDINSTDQSGLIKPNVLKRSFSTSDKTCWYNPLTLRMSMQNQHMPHCSSLSVSSAYSSSSYSASAKTSSNMSSSSGQPSSASIKTSQASQCPPSPSTLPHCGFPLPPKKRCFSQDTMRDSLCTSCSVTLVGEKSSRCPNGHSTCSKCLEERVKLVLTGKAKESIKCLNRSCDSYYPISELKMSLPSMVVEILEDKLDQDYVNYISDMILKNASSEPNVSSCPSVDMEQQVPAAAAAGGEREVTVEKVKYLKKYDDMPEHWDPVEEKTLNKNGYTVVKLEAEMSEYEEVVVQFFQSMVDHNVEVVSVYRVQNPIQWNYYTLKKAEMLRDNEGFGRVEEQQLFHGTSSSVVDAICRKGFDWRLCGKHGTMYGQGSYFAVNAAYSHMYTDQKQQRPFRSSMMLSNPMSMTLPTSPSLIYPAAISVSFPLANSAPQPMNMPSYTALNLSKNTPPTATNQPLVGSGMNQSVLFSSQSAGNQTGSLQQSLSPSVTGPLPGASGSQLNSMTSLLSPPPLSASAFKGCAIFSRSPSKPPRKCRLVPKPLMYRNVSGLPSANVFTTIEKPAKQTAQMFLARVLVGKYVGGSNKLRKPPPLDPKHDPFGKCYDSCVDDILNPKIFVIFDSTQAYPEYLIEYSCE